MKIVYNIYIIRDFVMSSTTKKLIIDKLAQARYNKKFYDKNKDKHNEICRQYYIEHSEILKKKE